MTLTTGTRLGPYEIVAALGAGGMGEVYRARDTKLRREVAIKVLPASVARDPDRLRRFEREAHLLAALNHPHIAAIYGLEESAGITALVLELVEGVTLADRIAAGPVPIEETLPIARQIAEALEAAHERSIIHRDLKPANVKLMPDGTIKVLDFGLAKVETSAGNLTQSPTITAMATREGIILGTAPYMSPEQARGKEVDKRADIWAFGCVLYELLTGARAFPGETTTDVLAAVVNREPDFHALPPATPLSIRRVLARCLDKDPKRRLRDIGEARLEIDDASASRAIDASAPAVPAQGRRVALGGVAASGLLVIALLGVAAWAIQAVRPTTDPLAERPVMRFEIPTPPTSEPMSFALSPDGRQLAFVATAEGVSRLWVRPLAQATALPLAGTAGASFPFWSPDSQSIGFFADAKLKRIDIAGGEAHTLADAIIGRGGSWNREGIILFAPVAGQIFRVPASGGEPVPVTRVAPPQPMNHRFPCFLPDGRHFLFYAQGGPDGRGVYLGTLDGEQTHRLLDANQAAVMSSDGRVLFVRESTLFAQTLDVDRGVLFGGPVPVAEQVAFDDGLNVAAVSASAAGPLVYRTGAADAKRSLVWFDRSGKETSVVSAEDTGSPSNPELSPDGETVALDRAVNGNRDVWLLETARGGRRRLTFDPAVDLDAIWSTGRHRIVFASNRRGVFDLFEKPSSGAGGEEPLLISAQHKRPLDVSPDGGYLLYREFNSDTSWDVMALPLGGDRKPFPVVQTRFEEREGQYSPDGKWVAYQSNETGQFEIYVQRFPGSGGTRQVSATGGVRPRWRRDGKELFYIALDGKIMAASIQIGTRGEVIDADIPVALFSTRLAEGPSPTNNNKHQYAVAPDGRRFLMNVSVEGSIGPPITIVLNWAGGTKN